MRKVAATPALVTRHFTLERRLVRRGAVDGGHRDVVEPQVDAELRAVMKDAARNLVNVNDVVHHQAAQHDYLGHGHKVLAGLAQCPGLQQNIIRGCGDGRTRRICRWRDGRMVLRWAAAFLMTEKHFRKIQGCRDLWMLKAVLHPSAEEKQATSMEQVA